MTNTKTFTAIALALALVTTTGLAKADPYGSYVAQSIAEEVVYPQRGFNTTGWLRNPDDSSKFPPEGTITIRFTLRPDGSVSNAGAEKNTSYMEVHSLERAALEALHRAQPFGPTPSGDEETYRLPIEFNVPESRQ